MRSLWFKACYVAAILRGEKTHTIRAGHLDIAPGTLLPASVGPRRPFAMLEVLSCEYISRADLAPEEADALAIYPQAEHFTRLRFTLH